VAAPFNSTQSKRGAEKMKPLAVLISGAPGSGKSTLAAKLAAYMRLPYIERDNVTRGMELTLGRRVSRPKESLPVYFSHIAALLDDNVSLVTDGTLYRGISEKDVTSYIVDHAFVVNVHTRAKNEHQRFYEREMNREGHSNDWVKDHMPILDEIYDQVVHPLDLGVPVIEVDATDGYEPTIPQLVAKIYALFTADRSAVGDIV
jgi:2-phosphoglycerate kinase